MKKDDKLLSGLLVAAVLIIFVAVAGPIALGVIAGVAIFGAIAKSGMEVEQIAMEQDAANFEEMLNQAEREVGPIQPGGTAAVKECLLCGNGYLVVDGDSVRPCDGCGNSTV